MPTDPSLQSRRNALKCLAFGGAGTLFALSGGVFAPIDLALAAADRHATARLGKPLFVQISDTHIGFKKDANPDVDGTLEQTIELVNRMPVPPALVIHTGDITHLSKPAEFDNADQLIGEARLDVHYVPGEHDVIDEGLGKAYLARYGKGTKGSGWYSFDDHGVHFIGLVNVIDLKAGGLGRLGPDQLAWLADDIKDKSDSTPIVVLAHIPLWTVYADWGWGTDDGLQALTLLKRFGSVTVLNGHIHQIVQKVEGNMTFHTARSTGFPQPTPGTAPSPGPMTVPAEQLRSLLGIASVEVRTGDKLLAITDTPLAG